ncbi:MAG TPA: hypothetical protein PKN32_05985 [Bacteroidales bacterium]|nr:hypothetical protein [Bacteroidales bacterium]
MKTRLLFFTALILAGVFYAQPSFSQNQAKEKKACLMDELSPEQQKKIETIKINSDKKIIQYKADLKIKKAEFDKLRIAENPSQKDINLKIDEMYLLKAEIKKEKVNTEMLIRNELTPEQREKFDMHRAMKDKDMGHKDHKKSEGCNPGSCQGQGQHQCANPKQMHHDCQNMNSQK